MLRPAQCLVTSLLTFLLISVSLASDPATAPSTGPSTTTVKRGTLDLTVKASGWFEPVESFEVRTRPKAYYGDLIVVSSVAPGAQVAKGDVLLELDSTQIKRQIAAAETELASAKANYEKAQSDVKLGDESDALALKMQEEEVRNAETGMKWWEQVDGKHMLESAELSVKNAKDNVSDQEDELDQLKKMYKSEELTNATADIVVKRALRALDRARIGLRMTEERAQKTKQNDYEVSHSRIGNGVQQQKQALDRLKAQQAQSKVARQGGLTGAKLALDAAEEKLANIKGDLEQFTINAPQSMVVFYGQLANGSWSNNNPRALRVGEKLILNPGHMSPAVQMTGFTPGKLRFVVEVPEEKILLVERGQKVTITPNALPQVTLNGTAGEPPKTPASGGSSYSVPVEVNSADPQLEPGMKGNAKIASGSNDNVLLVPTTAVKDKKVWLHQSEGTDKEVEVTVGRSDGENVEIKSGLKEGDQVLTTAKK
jgi:multidrug efflux pump subunit AcrA (membrane-fusion protein)